ncbi:MAG: GGDEF domain-containing protein [Oscillospiraceae bacterium]|nr:GGDEF domain-containing protein [Oscillospiraceae bacterium]
MTNRKRLHFGVLFTTIDNAGSLQIWKGIVEYAEMNNIHLTAYFGTYQSTDDDVAMHLETCFGTIRNSKFLDGVIILTGFLTKHVGIDDFHEYLSNIPKNIPIVSVAFPMPGVPSILVDGESGIFGAVDHLIREHNNKKIAFVKGPDGHPEAEERLKGYKRALESNGITINESLILPGNFSRESGRDAVIELLDTRKQSVDAIAACDDEGAIGVLTELKRRDIIVPSDIAVTGFNDDRAAAIFMPSISTARQDFFDIGHTSAKALNAKINGEKVEDITYVKPLFVPRQSCGCFEIDLSKTESKSKETPIKGDTLISYTLRNITTLFGNDIPKDIVQKWISNLAGETMAKSFDMDKFLHLFDEILINYSHFSQEFTCWYEALSLLTSAVEFHTEEVGDLHAVLSTLFYATTLVYDIRIKEEKNNEFLMRDARVHLKRATSAIVIQFDIVALAEELSKTLPAISLKSILVGLYNKPVKSNSPKESRVIDTLIGFDGKRKFNMSHNSWNQILFSDYSTIDRFDFDRERRSLFFIPLFFKDEELGVMLLPYQPHLPIETYESLRISISTAVKGAELLTTIQTLSITDELSGLLNRRGFFQFAYSRLSHLQRDTERMPFLMFMDMDGLKYINDTYGHNEGDKAISAFSEILKDTLREEDIIGRIGGDEFVVLSSVKSVKDGNQLVERIRDKLKLYNSKNLHPYSVQGSIGSIILEFATKICFEEAMLSADSLLYDEKMTKKKSGLSRQ